MARVLHRRAWLRTLALDDCIARCYAGLFRESEDDMDLTASDSSRTETASAPKAERPRRDRTERSRRPRRVARARTERVGYADADTLYRAEMASKKLLTPDEERKIGKAIVTAERTVLDALVRAPSGAAALASIGHDLEAERIDARKLLLNPDEDGLDVALTTERVRSALLAAPKCDEDRRSQLVDTLAQSRLDLTVVEGAVAALRDAVRERKHHADVAALADVDAARRELRSAKEQLVLGNLRLVVLFARKYENHGVPLLDLVQEGNVGLMRAADKFDFRRGFRFNTYAAWWIKQALQRALVDRPVRLPIHLAGDHRRIGKIRAKFATQHQREPTATEIAEITGLSLGRVQSILDLPRSVSLDAPVGEDGDARLVDFIAADTMPADDAAAARALGADLEELLGVLSARELQILRMRFGIGATREHTFEEIGRKLSLTRERIRQIERDALQKLRARSKRVDLGSYLRS